ncbi:hypothetical protein GW924_01555 [Candidatus Pacearchaeota archaeon]|nr:hypothetical protein [Candidatus Pacearchaeota archaeon]OIO43889.1 MAG: hypothetical protein AUJ64_01155 [Candidatus Pacearchaeota archaeon CG1_02_39_14]
MNSKDKISVIVLAILLLLLIVVSMFLLVRVYTSEEDPEPNPSRDYYNYTGLGNYDNSNLNNNEYGYNPINYENNRTYRGGGNGGGGSSKRNICDDGQIIMRLYGEENTHGALWNETVYSLKVCYNEIFGEMFDFGNRDPHQCSGNSGEENNLVLRLIKSFNSHAEAPEVFSGDYNLPVCYGDLQCTSRAECLADEEEIASLTGERNAHLESRDANNYPLKICCTSSGSF